MQELPFPDNMENTKELGFLDKNGNTVEIYIGSGGGSWYDDEGILEWWVVSNWWDDKPLRPNQEAEVKQFLNDYLRHHGVPKYEIVWRNMYDKEDGDESHCFITLNPLPADEEKLWKSLWEGNKTKCKHEDLSIKTMEVLNGELLLTLDCDKCGKRTSTSASLNQGWEAEDLNTWAKQELSSHGQNVSFKNWAKKEVKSHGNIDLVDWAKHEKQSHTKKYGAESFSLDSKKADSINMEEPMIEEPSFIPDGDGRAIGQQNSSINLSPLHAETSLDKYRSKCRSALVALHEALYDAVDGKPMTEADIEGLEASHPIIVDAVMRGSNAEGFGADDYTDGTLVDLNAESNQDIKWSDVKEMGNSKCPFCFRSAFRLLDEEGEEFSVYEENLAGDNWLLECSRCKAEWNQYGENTLDGGYTGNAESRFDKLSNEIADEYEEKGMSPEKAQEVGDATAAMIGRKKYGKKGMAKMQREGMNAEGFTDINYDAKIRLNNPKDAKYITPSIEDGMDFENGEGVLSSKSKIDLNAEGDSATYSPSDEPDMVNEIQTSPTNESPQLFNASNTFNTTTALGIGGLVVAALSLPMLYSSAKSRLGKSAEEKRKSNGSVRKNHTQVKNSEYSVGQVNPVEAEGQQDIHGAEGITNPRHSPSPTPSGYPSKNLKMW
jgi:hypothetical protein